VKVHKDAISVEDILINSPCAEPYNGILLCVYCQEYLHVKDITSVSQHIISQHLDVLAGTFSCPACLAPRCFNKETFNDHFQDTHTPTLALLSVLNDIATGSRLQYGLALHVTIFLINAFHVELPSPPCNVVISNRFGGYGPVNPAALTAEIKKHQAESMPPLWVAAHADATTKQKRAAARPSESSRSSPQNFQYSEAAKRKKHNPAMDYDDAKPGPSSWRESHRSPSPLPQRTRHRSPSSAPTPGSSILYDSEDDRQGETRSSDEEI
jgi:hypothetical protein